MSLTLPQILPDGSTLYQDADFLRRLHEGDATLGWTGDPRLGVYWADNCLEIRRLLDDGTMTTIMRAKPHVRVLNSATLKFLAEHDSQSRRAFNVVEEINRHNAQVERDKERTRQAKVEDAADRLRWALMKDLGAHAGGSTRRQMTLPAAPWKKDSSGS